LTVSLILTIKVAAFEAGRRVAREVAVVMSNTFFSLSNDIENIFVIICHGVFAKKN
jgi:hypothetical protein